jgi:hypothetical protein
MFLVALLSGKACKMHCFLGAAHARQPQERILIRMTTVRPPNPCSNFWFTASRHVWEAESSVEFYRAWREKPLYLIKNFDFTEFWQYGRVDDMDEFTRLIFKA